MLVLRSKVASVRSNTITWAHKKSEKTKTSESAHGASARRLIVFIIGGVTRSEMRVAHKLSESLSRDIIIGGTNPETPKSFLNSLHGLGSVSSDMVALNLSSLK